MRGSLKEGARWAAAIAAALPALISPVFNPDLFWHLSAGRAIIETGALPKAETLSFTLQGAPWRDFEWLTQVFFQAAWSLGGFPALWFLKALLVGLCAWALLRAARAAGAGLAGQAGALLVWGVAALSWADLRPELFSIFFFTLCLERLERIRLLKSEPDARAAVSAAALFSLWSCLHAGFPVALMLIAIYGVAEIIEGRLRRAGSLALVGAAAALGALVNPYGWGPYLAGYEHYLQRADLSKYILEWHPMTMTNPVHWPFYPMVVLAALAAAARLAEPYKGPAHWTRPFPWALMLACGHFAANGLMHSRMAAYFGVVAPVLLAVIGEEARGFLKKILLAGTVAAILFVGWLLPRVSWGTFNGKHVPLRASEFMAGQELALSPLRLFNQWEWGGYLSWRLRPWLKVFADGRYVFHDLLPVQSRATESPETWRQFMYQWKLSGALVPNREALYPTTRRYPDGTEKEFQRPWYVSFFPREHWALIYWDDQALLFVSRAAVPPSWLAAHEYRWLRPRDAEAFADALARGEVPAEPLAREHARHAEELALAPRSAP